MFLTALILACADVNQKPSLLTCEVFKSEISFKTYDDCLTALGYGIEAVESKGWYVKDYACFDWSKMDRGDL